MKKRIERKIAGMPQSYRAGYIKAIKGEASPREAIKANCLECMGWARQEVKKCNFESCPLYPYRPYQKKPVKLTDQSDLTSHN